MGFPYCSNLLRHPVEGIVEGGVGFEGLMNLNSSA